MEGRQLFCRDLGPGQTVDIYVCEWYIGVQTITEKRKGRLLVETLGNAEVSKLLHSVGLKGRNS